MVIVALQADDGLNTAAAKNKMNNAAQADVVPILNIRSIELLPRDSQAFPDRRPSKEIPLSISSPVSLIPPRLTRILHNLHRINLSAHPDLAQALCLMLQGSNR